MQLKLKNIVTTSVFTVASIGSAIATIDLFMPQPAAFARESLGECIQELRDYGISTREAANICRNQRDTNRDDDRDNRDDWDRNRDRRGRERYIEIRPRSGRTSGGFWRYYTPNVSDDSMYRAGCQRISRNDWRCNTPKIRVLMRDEWRDNSRRDNRIEYIEIRPRSGSTLEGRWRYSAPGVPDDAMQREGCEHISRDDWRCATPTIRVPVIRR
ncbi:MAG: hypothetical protein ACRAVC_08440 [Trichormus sp.]